MRAKGPDGPALGGQRRPFLARAVSAQVKLASPQHPVRRAGRGSAPITCLVHLGLLPQAAPFDQVPAALRASAGRVAALLYSIIINLLLQRASLGRPSAGGAGTRPARGPRRAWAGVIPAGAARPGPAGRAIPGASRNGRGRAAPSPPRPWPGRRGGPVAEDVSPDRLSENGAFHLPRARAADHRRYRGVGHLRLGRCCCWPRRPCGSSAAPRKS